MPLRRRLLAASGLLLLPTARAQVDAGRTPLPAMTDGPFYPPPRWREQAPTGSSDWDADLTEVRHGLQRRHARGEALDLQLQVVDSRGQAVDGCTVEIWQCDQLAAYRHPSVPLEAGRFDPGFQGFGAARSHADGRVAFRTIRPVPYPGRTPHIHIKLRHAGFGELTSQLFIDGEPGNRPDFLWRRLTDAGRASLAMQLQPATDAGLRWRTRHRLVVPA